MRKLTKIFAPALIAAMGLGAAAIPAQAAPYGRHDAGHATPVRNADIRIEINGLNRDINQAAARRAISGREATGLKRDAIQVQRLYSAYARNGLTRTEVNTLRARVDRIQIALHGERHDRNDHRR
jgi:hypothetical protein